MKNKIKYTTSFYIEKAKEIHKNRYNYALLEYKGSKNKIKIICYDHGIFEQEPSHHLRGVGCVFCGRLKSLQKQLITTSEFVEKAKKIHNNKFDYSKVIYKGSFEKISIICPVHGVFKQNPTSHLKGNNCFECHKEETIKRNVLGKKSTLQFIEESKIKFKKRFVYDKSIYKGSNKKITITCKNHGDFDITATSHLLQTHGGCRKCFLLNLKRRNKPLPEHLQKYSRRLRNCVVNAFRNNGYRKETKTYQVLGETFENVKLHLENNKYNFKITQKNIDIDHIIPCSFAKNEDELLKLNHYTNLQLLPKEYNRNIKSNKKFNREHFEKWFFKK